MGLIDKFKNLFTDEIIEEEEEETVKISEIKKEETNTDNKLPTFMREKIEKEEQTKPKEDKLTINKDIVLEPKKEKEVNITDNNISTTSANEFKFPVFDDNDFIETSRMSRQASRENNKEPKKEIKKEPKENKHISKEIKVADLYKDKKEKPKKEEKKFKATPIISPIYGVLDKNYNPDDVSTNPGNNYEMDRHSKNIDFDSVRKKAYGTLSDDIKENLMCENCEYLKEVKECKSKNKQQEKDDLLYPILEDEEEKNYNNITLDEATENYYDYGVEYAKENIIKEDEVKIVDHTEEPKKEIKEVPPVKNSINLLSTLKKSMGNEEEPKQEESKDLELTDDLFNLIDSMYEERND